MNTRLIRWSPAAILVIAGSTHSLAAGPFGAVFELSTLNGTNGFAINGIDLNDASGVSVSTAGDVNGDGVNDLIIGAIYADPNGQNDAGESYVIFGGAGVGASGVIELSALNGANGFIINGIDAGDRTGGSVSCAGDINGDGVDDLIIGSAFADPNGSRSGESYIIFGGAGIGASGTLELSSLNGSNGFVCNGINTNDGSGRSVSAAGDVNGDGADDLIIGAYAAEPPNEPNAVGESYVVFGGSGVGLSGILELSSLNGVNGFVCSGIGLGQGDQSGRSVSGAGDVNGDGVDDLIIGAPMGDPNGIGSGASYLVFGATDLGTGGVIELALLNGTNGFVINGVNVDDRSGDSVSNAGDVNGDGFDDVIIGAYKGGMPGVGSGASYVVFGSGSVGASGTLELSSLNGSDGFVMTSIGGGQSGNSVSGAGDVNGDGFVDVVIGSPVRTTGPLTRQIGVSHVVFSGPGVGAGGTIDLSSLNGANGFVCNGADEYDQSGVSVSSAGDINGDGNDDLIIGAWLADPNGASNAGKTYVVFGRTACHAADLNGDGVVDTADLGILLGQFGTPGPGADINGDIVVDTADLGILLGLFGTSCN